MVDNECDAIMPKQFEKMVKKIKKSCKASGKYSDERCENIAYGTATNLWKKSHHGKPPR